jgi:hypothetical protein
MAAKSGMDRTVLRSWACAVEPIYRILSSFELGPTVSAE